jgi:hypothetical protein
VGAVGGEDGFFKPEYEEEEVVPLRFGLGKKKVEGNGNGNGAVAPAVAVPAPVGVGFVDFSDDLDLDAEDDEDVIDEETLLTEEDMLRPIQQPPECQPQPGKKRRACKDWYVVLSHALSPTNVQTANTQTTAHAVWHPDWKPRTRRGAPRLTRV